MGLLEDLVSSPFEALALGLTVFVFVSILSALGTAVANLPGGAQAANTANLGIVAIITIAGVSGVVGAIAFGKEILEAIEGIFNGESGGLF
jgi:hypothetical protein